MSARARTARTQAISKVHVARRDLALDDGTYRALLRRVTGKATCSVMAEQELAQVIEEFRRLGWSGDRRLARRADGRAMAMTATARKIRAIWLSLWDLGELDDPSEEALAAFVLRTTGVEALQWVDGFQADQVIRALLGWQERIGLPRADALFLQAVDQVRATAKLLPLDEGFGLKCWLISYQWKLLNLPVPLNVWLAQQYGAAAPAMLTPQKANRVVERLGEQIRKRKGKDERPG